MLDSNCINLLLGIKGESIKITNVGTIVENRNEVLIVSGVLTEEFNRCPECGGDEYFEDKKMIVKNGTKVSRILMCDTSIHKVHLNLKKQRYTCRHCQSHFTSRTTVVNPYCFISNQVKFKILESLKEKRAASRIAKACHVSWSTVQRVIQSLVPLINHSKEWLPECLMVDEFRFKSTAKDKFAFICADGNTGKLFDILPSRRVEYLIKHFNSFTLEARKMVKYIVTDMNAPYFKLAKECFPNAQVVVDRFHIVQHTNRQFNYSRIKTMKSLNQNNPEQARQYKQLKSLYKLLLKDKECLDSVNYYRRRNFKWLNLSERDVVHRLLSISDELKSDYYFYQTLLNYFRNGNSDEFYTQIKNMPSGLSKAVRHIRKAFLKYEDGIRLAMKLPYSNGKIECMNTHIKTQKRVSYGFKSFKNMRSRIFLQNDLIKFNA